MDPICNKGIAWEKYSCNNVFRNGILYFVNTQMPAVADRWAIVLFSLAHHLVIDAILLGRSVWPCGAAFFW